MTWKNGTGFEDPPGSGFSAPRQDSVFDGETVGLYQTARHLTYVLFYNASHMVTFDYPLRALDMFNRFARVDIVSILREDREGRDDSDGPKTGGAEGSMHRR